MGSTTEMRSIDAETFKQLVATVRKQRTEIYGRDGGPIHPSAHTLNAPAGSGLGDEKFVEFGMTLRDYFAAQFMAARLANPIARVDVTDEEMAAVAYVRADAMLAARAK